MSLTCQANLYNYGGIRVRRTLSFIPLAAAMFLMALWGYPQAAAADPQPPNTFDVNPDFKAGGRGSTVFQSICAACHGNIATRAPSPAMLGLLSPNTIVRTLRVGVMKGQGEALSDSDKVAVAEFLTKHKVSDSSDDHLAPPQCNGDESKFSFDEPPLPGSGFNLRNTHSIPDGIAGIDKANLSHLHLKWAVGFSGAIRARSQPAVAGGAIFVGSQDGIVYALDPGWLGTALRDHLPILLTK
jgi:polyvinyl alcohol dehydrogenase (cytochrome)